MDHRLPNMLGTVERYAPSREGRPRELRPTHAPSHRRNAVLRGARHQATAESLPRSLASIERRGVDLGEHVQFVINSLKPHAEELGIAGKSTRPSQWWAFWLWDRTGEKVGLFTGKTAQ